MTIKIASDHLVSKVMIPYYQGKVAQIIAEALVKNCPAHMDGSDLVITVPQGKDWENIVVEAIETARP